MASNDQKKAAAVEAIRYVEEDSWVGVGTGSTVAFFIDELARIKNRIKGAVASSDDTARKLKAAGIEVEDLNHLVERDVPVYVDGADEVTEHGAMIKGGGGALTREKIISAVARKFVCIADASKLVPVLGKFPLPVEVIPMARSYVARQLVLLGGQPAWRMGVTTDNGNVILDVSGLKLLAPAEMEAKIRAIAGVVTVGLFAERGADVIVLGGDGGVQTIVPRRP